MRLLKASDHRRMAWKNGGGETIEIAVHPPGAGLDAFDWRVSMARVAGDGPFSVFPGIDRTLCLLAGDGMALAIEGLGEHALTTASPPFAFPADTPTWARLPGGPILDLNVMTRRDRCRHRVARIADAGRLDLDSRWSLLVALAPCGIETERGDTADLSKHDALLFETPLSLAVTPRDEAASALVIEIDAIGV